MDIKMPVMDGYTAVKLIREKNTEIPIIAQTAYAMENEQKECYKAGCDHYLTKPFDQELLLKVLNNYLQLSN